MKTLKSLKITSLLNGIFCLCCIISVSCMAINHYLIINSININIFAVIGAIANFGWMINPVGIISFFVSLIIYVSERKNPESKQVIGKKWIWIFILPVITTIFYLTSIYLFVQITGGV